MYHKTGDAFFNFKSKLCARKDPIHDYTSKSLCLPGNEGAETLVFIRMFPSVSYFNKDMQYSPFSYTSSKKN